MSAEHTDLVRTGAAAAAAVLAVLSRGDALVLAALLLVVAWHLPALAVVPALLASSWRWGSTSLDALAGAQAVLGPAGFVGPGAAAAASWVAAATVVLASPALRSRALVALAFGASAADLVAGPSLGGSWWARVVATVLATGAALLVGRAGLGHRRSLDALVLAGGIVSLVLVAGDAPRWSGTLDGAAMRTGAVVAVAVALVSVVGGRGVAAMRRRGA